MLYTLILQKLSTIVNIVVKYKIIKPLVVLTTMFDNGRQQDMQDHPLHTLILQKLSIIVTIVVKYKNIKPLVVLERQCLTMFDNRESDIIHFTHDLKYCQLLSLLSLNKTYQAPCFFNDNVRQCLTIGYEDYPLRTFIFYIIVNHCHYCR